ncbi:MAG: hypothetical protein ABR910_11460 [Acidobacteriaceae bacterium]
MELSVLFPFRTKFRQLGLSSRWWHRLAIAMFAVALLAVLLIRISETIDDYDEKDGELSSEALEFAHQEMKPDHRASPAQREALNNYFEEISANVDHQADQRLYWDVLFTFGLLTSLSYVLQSVYGAIIWAAYRNKLDSERLGHGRA